MTRFHATSSGPVAFTAPEEAARDAEEAAAALPQIPKIVEKRKLMKAIITASADTAFDSALPQNGGGQQGKLDRADWGGLVMVQRNSVLLERIRVSAGWSQAQVDGFFTSANALNGG